MNKFIFVTHIFKCCFLHVTFTDAPNCVRIGINGNVTFVVVTSIFDDTVRHSSDPTQSTFIFDKVKPIDLYESSTL